MKRFLQTLGRDPLSALLSGLVWASAGITLTALLFTIFYIVIRGLPHLSADLFAWQYTSENVSLMPALINTLWMTALALAVSVPTGVGAAIYLTEYARRGSRLVTAVRLTTETLSGIPSIVFGLFGNLFFVNTLGMGLSLLSGGLTLALMILPLILRTAEEALRAVPDSFREGSFGLGAGKLRTVFCVVLPSAIPGILSGIILGVGRIVGETAALIYTAGSIAKLPSSIMSSGSTLAVHMYNLSSEGLYMDQAYATAVVLLVLVVGINTLSGMLAKKLSKI